MDRIGGERRASGLDPGRSLVKPEAMRLIRRVLLALGGAAAIAGILRVRGSGGVPPQTGGWRELDIDEPPVAE